MMTMTLEDTADTIGNDGSDNDNDNDDGAGRGKQDVALFVSVGFVGGDGHDADDEDDVDGRDDDDDDDDDDDGDDPKDSLAAHDQDVFAEAAAFTAVLVNSSSRGCFWGAVVGFSMLQHFRCFRV